MHFGSNSVLLLFPAGCARRLRALASSQAASIRRRVKWAGIWESGHSVRREQLRIYLVYKSMIRLIAL
jgi:hypothetical protein